MVEEGEPLKAQPVEAGMLEEEMDPEGDGVIERPAGDGPLRALPVEPLDSGTEAVPLDPPQPAAPAAAPVEPSRPIRALPVAEDEVIEGEVEEP